jgi:hypothetical protein
MSKVKSTDPTIILREASTEELLLELKSRGGHPAALAEAILLVVKKSSDYNRTSNGVGDIHLIDRGPYFPFGALSYAQMIHTKSMRFNSLVRAELSGNIVNFEGLRDTALDLINYAGFFIASGGR